MKKNDELHSCTHIVMQPATFKEVTATDSATPNATVDLKALALEGLKRNIQRNKSATNPPKQCNSNSPNNTAKVASKKQFTKAQKPDCDDCKHFEEIPPHGGGCVSKTNGKYQYQWNLLDTLDKCPRGSWN
jgi:hypothetical protein